MGLVYAGMGIGAGAVLAGGFVPSELALDVARCCAVLRGVSWNSGAERDRAPQANLNVWRRYFVVRA